MLCMVIPIVLIILSRLITNWSFQEPESSNIIRGTTKYTSYMHSRHHPVRNPESGTHNGWPC